MIPQQLNLFEDEQLPLRNCLNNGTDVNYSSNASIKKISKQDSIVLIHYLELIIYQLKVSLHPIHEE